MKISHQTVFVQHAATQSLDMWSGHQHCIELHELKTNEDFPPNFICQSSKIEITFILVDLFTPNLYLYFMNISYEIDSETEL